MIGLIIGPARYIASTMGEADACCIQVLRSDPATSAYAAINNHRFVPCLVQCRVHKAVCSVSD